MQAPIFHVNGDDPEAVVHVARIATEFRQKFKRDVVIDMFCYRRYGHNEADEPSFTQPMMYRTIAKHPTTRQIYAEKLIDEGVLTAEDVERMGSDVRDRLQAGVRGGAAATSPTRPTGCRASGPGLNTADRRRGTARRRHLGVDRSCCATSA